MKRPIPETYTQTGYVLTLVEESENLAIYHQDGETYEVVRKRWYPESHRICPGKFRRPSPEEWGVFGWTCHTLERSRERVREQELIIATQECDEDAGGVLAKNTTLPTGKGGEMPSADHIREEVLFLER